MIVLNSIIATLAEFGQKLCVLIGLFMISSKLGAVTLGLYGIMKIADYLIAREYAQKMKQILGNSEKL
jgi:hypothetical protein